MTFCTVPREPNSKDGSGRSSSGDQLGISALDIRSLSNPMSRSLHWLHSSRPDPVGVVGAHDVDGKRCCSGWIGRGILRVAASLVTSLALQISNGDERGSTNDRSRRSRYKAERGDIFIHFIHRQSGARGISDKSSHTSILNSVQLRL